MSFSPYIRKRAEKKLMTTTYGNELADAITSLSPAPLTGTTEPTPAIRPLVNVLQITGYADAGGIYRVGVMTGAIDASSMAFPGTLFTMPAGMSAAVYDTEYAVNLSEAASASHVLKIGAYALGVLSNYAFDGSRVYVIQNTREVIVRITGPVAGGGGGKYNGRMQFGDLTMPNLSASLAMPLAMTEAASDDCYVVNLRENALASHWLGSGRYVVGHIRDRYAPDGKPIIVVSVHPPYTLSVVDLATDGGADGNATSPPTYTYTVTDEESNALGTALAPEWARPNGSFTAATVGTGYWAGSGNSVGFVLFQANEVEVTAGCATPTT